MISKKETQMAATSSKPARKRGARIQYSANQKCQAVLSLWTEKSRPTDLCREMKINYMVLNHWQERALEGMLQALSSRVDLGQGQLLSPRLQQLLEKRDKTAGVERLERKLEKMQEEARSARKTEG